MVKGKPAGVGDVFQGGDSVGAYLWIGDLGDDLLNGSGFGVFSTQGGQVDHRETYPEASVRKLVLPPLGGDDVVVGAGGGGWLCLEE